LPRVFVSLSKTIISSARNPSTQGIVGEDGGVLLCKIDPTKNLLGHLNTERKAAAQQEKKKKKKKETREDSAKEKIFLWQMF
jgi:hypothetical protein